MAFAIAVWSFGGGFFVGLMAGVWVCLVTIEHNICGEGCPQHAERSEEGE